MTLLMILIKRILKKQNDIECYCNMKLFGDEEVIKCRRYFKELDGTLLMDLIGDIMKNNKIFI